MVMVGVGTDVHALDAQAPCWLAGLHWPGEAGLAGHSDGDVVAHACADALLNAKRGNLDKGFAFTGINAHLINSIESVKDVFASLQKEFDEAMAKFSWTFPGFGGQKAEGEEK